MEPHENLTAIEWCDATRSQLTYVKMMPRRMIVSTTEGFDVENGKNPELRRLHGQ